MSTPDVSIVIPTHNRWPILQQCLAAIAQQELTGEGLEVVIVADGCTDGTETELARRPYSFALKVLSQPAAGAAAARNRGASAASGRILLFMDDDIIPSPGLVAAHLREHREGASRAVIGPCRLATGSKESLLHEALSHFWEQTYAAMADPAHRFTFKDVLTGNLSIRAETFRDLGGLDERFRDTGEDYEFGWRLLQAGIPVAFAAEAKAVHMETTDLSRALQRHRHAGQAAVLMSCLHPGVPATAPPSPLEGALLHLARSAPRAGKGATALGIRLLGLAERLRSRRLWSFVYKRLKGYYYWQGVADATSGTPGETASGATGVLAGDIPRGSKGL